MVRRTAVSAVKAVPQIGIIDGAALKGFSYGCLAAVGRKDKVDPQ
jgi:hypothetical protein